MTESTKESKEMRIFLFIVIYAIGQRRIPAEDQLTASEDIIKQQNELFQQAQTSSIFLQS